MKSIRNLGLAVVTVAALAVLPAMASASGGIVADKYGTDLRASQIGNFNASVGAYGSSECYFGETQLGEITGPSATYALSGTGAKCSNALGEVAVEMNNCKFEFDPATQSLAVGPPTCSSIATRVGSCRINILPQTGLTAAQTNQEGAETDTVLIDIEATAKYEIKKEEAGCMKKGVFSGLTLNGEFKLTGYRAEGEFTGPAVDIEVIQNGLLPVGVFMSESLAKFEAQVYPVQYQAAPAPSGQLKLYSSPVGTVACQGASANKLEASASAIKFTAFSGCTFAGQSATVKANSCGYEFNGSVSVSCTKEGDKLEIETYVCTFTLAPQSLSGSGYTPKNAGAGSSATVGINSAATGVKTGKAQTQESQKGCILFPKEGTGTFAADVTLSGTYAG